MAHDLVEKQGKDTSQDTNSDRKISVHRDMRRKASATATVSDTDCCGGFGDVLADVFCLRPSCLYDLGEWAVSDIDEPRANFSIDLMRRSFV